MSKKENEKYEGEYVYTCAEAGCGESIGTPGDPYLAGYALGHHGWDLYAFHETMNCPVHSRSVPWKGVR